MSKIFQAALNFAEAEREHALLRSRNEKAIREEAVAFCRIQDARSELDAACEEQVEKARDFVNGADLADEAPEECAEKARDLDLGEIQLMPPTPHIEVHVQGCCVPVPAATEVIEDLIDWAEAKVRSSEEGSVNHSLYCHFAWTIEQKAKEAGIR
jgi:hypothetical protein